MKERIAATVVLGLRYLFVTRYSWLLGLALIALTPLALRISPGMLANLFVLDLPEQVYHVSWITFWCALAVMETLRVTTLNVQYRIDDYRVAVEQFRKAWWMGAAESRAEWYRRWEGWLCLFLGVLTALAMWYVVVEACISCTAADPAPTWAPYVGTTDDAGAVAALGWREAVKGLLTTAVILGGINGAIILWHEWLRRSGKHGGPRRMGFVFTSFSSQELREARVSRRSPFILRAAHFLLGPGYFREVTADGEAESGRLRLASGHLGLLTYTAAFLAWYAVNYRSATGLQPMPTELSPYPALAYGLLSLLLVTYLLSGFAFYFDRYRIPVSLVAVFATLLLYDAFGTDHFYELNPAPERREASAAEELTDIYDQWELPQGNDGRRTLVVMHASGGGIQASAWTAQVMTGLHECYGDKFSQSIGLISAVSGGSVGTAYYLIHRGEMEDGYRKGAAGAEVLSDDSIHAIRELSRSSAMEATAWGIAYPDAMRVFPPVVASTLDRGWAMERVWRQRMTSAGNPSRDLGDLRVTDLAPLCKSHQLPVVVFNATLVETGQRLLISPVLSPPALAYDNQAAVELRRVFPQAHPLVSTAARLSATFPYVTPAARAAHGRMPSAGPLADRVATYHVVDGGYADNEGAVTSVDWINRLLVYYSRDDKILHRPFEHVLLVRIQAFPRSKGVDIPRASSPLAGWRSALLGPLDAMMKVRAASQTERGDLEVNLLTQATIEAIRAAKERFESEFKAAQTRVDVLQQAADSLETYLPALAGQGQVSEADVARRLLESRDRVAAAQAMVEEAAKKRARISQLTVASVLFDFRLAKEVGVPLSWKLTSQQKRNIDAAWERLASAQPRHPALAVIDEHFPRRK